MEKLDVAGLARQLEAHLHPDLVQLLKGSVHDLNRESKSYVLPQKVHLKIAHSLFSIESAYSFELHFRIC